MKNINKIIIGMILLMTIIPLVSGADIDIYKQNEVINIEVPCVNSDKSVCDITTNCTIRIQNPDTTLHVYTNMSYNVGFYNYTMTDSSVLGTYSVLAVCEGATEDGYSTFEFIITIGGTETTNGSIAVYIFFLIVMVVILFFSIKIIKDHSLQKDIVSGKGLYEMKKRSETKFYLSVLGRKLWIVGMFGIYLSLLLFTSISSELGHLLSLPLFVSLSVNLFVILAWGLIPFMIFWLVYIIFYLWHCTTDALKYQFGGFMKEGQK